VNTRYQDGRGLLTGSRIGLTIAEGVLCVADDAPTGGADLQAQLRELRSRLQEAEEAQRRSELLAEASAVLSDSLDHHVVLAQLARLMVGSFSDWCVVDLVEDGEIRRVAGAAADPAKEHVLEELQRRFPPRWDSPHPATRVLTTGQPLVFPEVTEADARRMSESDEHRLLGEVLGARSGLCVPLEARGRLLGALTAGSARPDRRFGPPDVELILEVARRAAIAIENAQLYHQSQEALRLRDEFLSVASHELNTPMAALMLSLEGLGTPDPDLQLDARSTVQVAKLAERQGRRLTKMIGDLLDVTRLARGSLALHCEEVELTALVREVVARYKPELERAGCEISLDLAGPVQGLWDPMRLDQVVLNLLANAAKFGAHKPIELAVARVGDRARLTVSDHGIGVDPSQHTRIFERFERGVSSHHYGGLGLGLYICKRIVESHGGVITMDSRPGHGATFLVELPLQPPES
jgi:signal transduction histidine kinase